MPVVYAGDTDIRYCCLSFLTWQRTISRFENVMREDLGSVT